MTAEHYFTPRPTSPRAPRLVSASLRGRTYRFATAGGVFARRGVDPGTRLLIETLAVEPGDLLLDLGCGFGPVGIVAATLGARAVMVDLNARAAALARDNVARNGAGTAWAVQADGASACRPGAFDVVATNPPIRAGRAAVRRFIEDGRSALRPGGRFYLVARTAQGARTLGRIVAEVFGDAGEVARGSGYRVYCAVRPESPPAGGPA